MITRDFDISVDLKFLSTSDGGRKTPVFSSYRGKHDFGLEEVLLDAVHEYVGTNQIMPGQSAYAYFTFLSPELLNGKLTEGFKFKVQEGNKIVATGKVSKIFNNALRCNAKQSIKNE
ncbi:hypothetical protein [Glaciecola sp. 1036]|uniref:hypothetical protein n=1 Tax=Alteromonadaceae TaxID=72275 RepID=UPI003CFEA20F